VDAFGNLVAGEEDFVALIGLGCHAKQYRLWDAGSPTVGALRLWVSEGHSGE
jgi:hypothetical protein